MRLLRYVEVCFPIIAVRECRRWVPTFKPARLMLEQGRGQFSRSVNPVRDVQKIWLNNEIAPLANLELEVLLPVVRDRNAL